MASQARGLDARLDAHVAGLAKELAWLAKEASPAEQQASARSLVATAARALQGATLLRHAADSAVAGPGAAECAALFAATRLGGGLSAARSNYGTLPRGPSSVPAALEAIINRHSP